MGLQLTKQQQIWSLQSVYVLVFSILVLKDDGFSFTSNLFLSFKYSLKCQKQILTSTKACGSGAKYPLWTVVKLHYTWNWNVTAQSILLFQGDVHTLLFFRLVLKSVCPPWLKGGCVSEVRRYCLHALIMLFCLTPQATKFRKTPGSGDLRWEQVNTCSNSWSWLNGKAHHALELGWLRRDS